MDRVELHALELWVTSAEAVLDAGSKVSKRAGARRVSLAVSFRLVPFRAKPNLIRLSVFFPRVTLPAVVQQIQAACCNVHHHPEMVYTGAPAIDWEVRS